MNNGLNAVFFVIGGVWLSVVTFVLWRVQRHYQHLVSKTGKTGLKEILETILRTDKELELVLGEVKKKLTEVDLAQEKHIQRLGVIRFNPFADTGGSQSFVLALLDSHDNGFVLTSLYARGGGRWYIKQVHRGRGVELALSKEEEAAIKGATSIGAV